MDTKELIATAMKHGQIKNANQLRLALGISSSTVTRYMNGKQHPEPYIASLIAEIAGMKPEAGIAICEHDRAKTPAERKHWKMRICVDCPLETAECADRRCSTKTYTARRA